MDTSGLSSAVGRRRGGFSGGRGFFICHVGDSDGDGLHLSSTLGLSKMSVTGLEQKAESFRRESVGLWFVVFCLYFETGVS